MQKVHGVSISYFANKLTFAIFLFVCVFVCPNVLPMLCTTH